MKYSENRSYGYNIILKKYTKFPLYLPLPCHMEHGWSARSKPLKSDLKTDKPLMMVFSGRRAKAWQKESKIPVVVMGSPFILYRRMKKLTQKKNAKGTIVFPSHSTYFTRSSFDIEECCRLLKQLPREFQPITVCLFWLDYIDPSAEIYRRYGFKVVSAGVKIANSLSFVANFYEIMASHKYATSNDIGSYTFYAVEMGIPFFITGSSPLVINKGGKDRNIDVNDRLVDHAQGRKASNLFSTGPVKNISPEQMKFVQEEMGIDSLLSSGQMNKLFWKHFKVNHYSLAVLPYLIHSVLISFIFNGPWISLLTRVRKKMTS